MRKLLFFLFLLNFPAFSQTWTHPQGNWFHLEEGSPETQIAVTLPGTPTPGNLIVGAVAVAEFDASQDTITSLKDGNGVNLTYTTHSPNPAIVWTNVGQMWMFYYVVPVSPSATITATVTMSASSVSAIWADEFHLSSGTPNFHIDLGAQSTTSAISQIVTAPPSITVSTGELLYAICAVDSGLATAPTVNSPWTLAGSLPIGGANEFQAGAYILSSSAGATTMSFNDTAFNDSYGAIIAAFNAGGGGTTNFGGGGKTGMGGKSGSGL